MKKNIHNSISIIIPCYNEEANIAPLVERIHAALSKENIAYELIFIDDNSTDNTRNIIRELSVIYPIILNKKVGRRGKAFSIQEGIRYAQFETIAMIDADLQYPPEALYEMTLKLEEADIVVANRKKYKDSLLRKSLSSTFRFVFGKTLFGLNHDIQSGLKVFRREVIDTVKFEPKSPWTFDLEFLHRANQAGFSIHNFDITFARRKNGVSKLNFIKQTFEIGVNALSVRAKRVHPVRIPPKENYSMLGAGIGFKKKKYITHTTMLHHVSALRTFTIPQRLVIIFITLDIALGIYVSPLLTLQIIVAILSSIYFIDVFFNLYLIAKSLSFPQEITSTDKEINKLKDSDLPVYSILCPLYREGRIIHQFLEAIGKLSWPKKKLDVILLLEEDDRESIELVEKMDLPFFVRALVVPDSDPKTKPKACNYGLAHAKGEYLVIYDAEDIPEVLQLKKAYLGFGKAKKDTICLQAKLNYYNPHQNLLTRFFTAEYSLWFDVMLTGLQSIDTTIPLGGTSNHFKLASLREVEGWDPFNVTEDADLGVRLFRKGYKTAIIDSTTLEEANSRFGNWLRQRSRWIKGYMQTYLVHTRTSTQLEKGQGVHGLIFHLLIGGKLAFVLINPLLWLATFAYFALYAYVGPQIETLYPSLVFYMAVTSLVLGNFLFLYYYMIGLARKGQWNLMKFVFLIPFYWLMISGAAFIALYQLIFKPHYWEKTVHGLHLAKKKEDAVTEVVTEVGRAQGMVFPKEIRKKLGLALSGNYLTGGIFISSIAAGNFLNFLYNAYLGRVLNLSDFALVSFFSGLLAISGVVANPFGKTVNYKTGYLIGRQGEEAAFAFWGHIRKRAVFISVTLSILWLAAAPLTADFFKLANIYPVIAFLPVILFGFIYHVDTGFLSSRLRFGSLAVLTILEPAARLGFALLLVYIGLKYWTFAAIPISIIAVFLAARFILAGVKANKKEAVSQDVKKFPIKFFIAALISGLSTIAFLNFDVVLAKHYLAPSDAGLYALISLVGKMVFFLGSFASPFIMPLVARNEGARKDSGRVLSLSFAATFILSGAGFIAFGIFGQVTTPILFGDKVIPLAPYLIPVCFAMLCFSLSRVLTEYYLAKKYYTFSAVTFLLACAQVLVLSNIHTNVASFVVVMSAIWISHLALTFTLHLSSRYVRVFENNIADLFGLFANLKSTKTEDSDKLRILIFNWRDTKHKWAGGAEVYVHELAKRWVKQGNSVTLFCGNSLDSPRNEIIDGVQIYRRGGFYTVYIWALVYYMFKFRSKYDVIIDSENGIPFFTPIYTGTKKFLLIHHVHQEVFRKSLKPPFSWLALFLEAKLMPLLYRNVQVITVSPSSRDEILKHKLTKKEPLVIYNGVDLKQFRPGKRSTKPLILYVGRLQPYKSLHVFVAAARKILAKIPNAEFVIAGSGQELNHLKKLAEKFGILSKIKFPGYVSHVEKVKLMQRAWVFVNPSLMEGWGITTIEAAACGTPAVASDVPGLRDSIKDSVTGVLISYGDSDAFAKNIIKLIENNKLRKEMSRDALAWSRYFPWEKSADSLLEIITKEISVNRALVARRVSYLLGKLTSLF